MTFTYSLTEEDYLNFQLFQASQSPRIRRRMRITWLFMVAFSALYGAYMWWTHRPKGAMIMGGLAVVLLVLYPNFLKWRYKRNSKSYVRENFKNNIGKEAILEFGDNVILVEDFEGKTELNHKGILDIFETGDHFFVKLTSGLYLIVPKRAVPVETLRDNLRKIDAEYHDLPNWKW